jgi:hypothetical protein
MKRTIAFGVSLLVLAGAGMLAWMGSNPPVDETNAVASQEKPPVAEVEIPATTLDDFQAWASKWSGAAPGAGSATIEEGVKLAAARKDAFVQLMRADPERALEESVSFATYRQLPPEVRAFVEEPFSEIAKVAVLPICQVDGQGTPLAHQIVQVSFATEGSHEAFVYGRRMGVSSKEATPIQGVRLDGVAALWESTFLPVTGADLEIVEDQFPLANAAADRSFASGELVGDQAVTAVAGGQRFVFKDEAEFQSFDAAVSKLDESPGPKSGAGLLFAMPKGTDGSEGFDLDGLMAASAAQASSWTETPKSVFLIRVDFPDRTSTTDPLPAAGAIESVFDTTVDGQIQVMSYGKTEIECTVSTTTYFWTMPRRRMRWPTPLGWRATMTLSASIS